VDGHLSLCQESLFTEPKSITTTPKAGLQTQHLPGTSVGYVAGISANPYPRIACARNNLIAHPARKGTGDGDSTDSSPHLTLV